MLRFIITAPNLIPAVSFVSDIQADSMSRFSHLPGLPRAGYWAGCSHFISDCELFLELPERGSGWQGEISSREIVGLSGRIFADLMANLSSFEDF